MLDYTRLQRLIAEYGRLRTLDGATAQARGQRFNEVIAEMLGCWGIEARTSIRSAGEIDVVFALGGVRYVVEAKWERAKTNTGHLAKLQKRVRQRLAGTYGIFLSMSGYTAEALADLTQGDRLEVLLLDGTHFEAMLSGMVPPEELLSLVHDRAAFHAQPYTTLATLLGSSTRPAITFVTKTPPPHQLVRSSVPGFDAKPVLVVPDSGQLGIACVQPDQLLVTTQHGIIQADLIRRSAALAVPVVGCHRNAAVTDEGAILFTRKHGVGQHIDGQISVVAGGFAGNTCLFPGADGSWWLFANGEPWGQPGALVSRLGNRLGEEEHTPVGYPQASGMNCCWLNAEEILISGSAGVSVTNMPSGASRRIDVPQSNPMGLTRLTSSSVLTGGDELSLFWIDTSREQHRKLGELNLRGSVNEIAVGPDGVIYLAAYRDDVDGTASSFTVAQVAIPQVAEPTRHRSTRGFGDTTVVDRPIPAKVTLTSQRDSQPTVAPATQHESTQLPEGIASWPVSLEDRGNNAGQYRVFASRSTVYWIIVVLNTALALLLLLLLPVSDIAIPVRIGFGAAVVFLITVTIGFAKMAKDPIRLEIGQQGIQVFARSGTTWFPWNVISRVEVMRLEGGNAHLVAWCPGANMFPDFDGFGGGPRFLPKLGAVAVCPLNVLKARRHHVVRALYDYGGNRVGIL